MLDEYDLAARQAAMQSDLEAIYARLGGCRRGQSSLEQPSGSSSARR
jgi:hypothetical protein